MIDQVKSIGIEKGKAVQTRRKTQEILKAATRGSPCVAGAESTRIHTSHRHSTEGAIGTCRSRPTSSKDCRRSSPTPISYPVDDRGISLHSSASSAPRTWEQGQFYLMTFKDKEGRVFAGSSNYRLTVPANAPVNQYWSATAYDRATHALIRNLPWPSRSSQTRGLQKNAGRFGEYLHRDKSSARARTANWLPTSANGNFEILFRFYGPEKPLFDKTWRLPDIQEVQ